MIFKLILIVKYQSYHYNNNYLDNLLNDNTEKQYVKKFKRMDLIISELIEDINNIEQICLDDLMLLNQKLNTLNLMVNYYLENKSTIKALQYYIKHAEFIQTCRRHAAKAGTGKQCRNIK